MLAPETLPYGDLDSRPRKARGTVSNRDGRFEPFVHELVDDGCGSVESEDLEGRVPTTVSIDASLTVIARNDSPDIPFDRSINPYRGCEHGCVYCFASPTHAFLGLSPGLDFETRLLAKPEAAKLLRAAGRLDLAAPRAGGARPVRGMARRARAGPQGARARPPQGDAQRRRLPERFRHPHDRLRPRHLIARQALRHGLPPAGLRERRLAGGDRPVPAARRLYAATVAAVVSLRHCEPQAKQSRFPAGTLVCFVGHASSQ